jgi:hypothetical protein
VLIFFPLLLLAAHGANVAAKLKPIPPCPPLAAAAGREHIPLEEMTPSSGTNALRPGDSATVLVTFVQKKKQTQWLLYLEALAPNPSAATNKPTTFVVNSAFGPPMKFKSRPYPVKLRMLGPFIVGATKQPKVKATAEEFSLNEDYLALGFGEAASLLHRWSRMTNFTKGVTSKALRTMNPTLAEQRAICGTFPALISYFEIVEHTEGLEDLLRKLIELPSLWSIIKHRGVTMTITFSDSVFPSPADPGNWNREPSAPAFYFPWVIQLNGEPALNVTLVTTSPRPPLLICGGVVGLVAEKIGDEETYMTLRVISARRMTE